MAKLLASASWSIGVLGGTMAFFCSAEPAAAQQSIVSACAGVSLPRSVVTDILGPVVTGVVQPVESVVNPVLGVVGALLPGVDPLSIDASGLLSDAASGAPITLSVLNSDGVVAGPSDECIATSDGVTLDQEAGIAIGGNRISGLGQNGQGASASDIEAIALGNGASTAGGAMAAIAIGHDASASGTGSMALGEDASATAPNSVALGAGSATGANLAAPAYDPSGEGVAGAVPAGEISVGTAGQERRITNVAAGAADTDGANIGQLKALDSKFTEMAGWSLRYDSAAKDVATLEGSNGTRIRNVTAGELSATSMDAVNGAQLHATNQALEALSDVSVRYDVDGNGDRTNSVTLQGGDAGAPVRVRNVAAGVDDTDAANVGQLNALDQKFTDMVGWSVRYDSAAKDVATLEGVNGTRLRNVTAGELSATSMDAVNGSQLHATNEALAELSNLSVRYDVDGNGDRTNSVTLQGGNADAPVRVRNVAAGVDDTDAVNVAQLESGLGEGRNYVDQSISNSHQLSKAYTDEQVGKVRSESRQAAAIGLAAASIRFDNTPGKVSVGASGGFWRGEGAFAVGLGYTSETGRVRANATATTAGGAMGAGAGFSLTLN